MTPERKRIERITFHFGDTLTPEQRKAGSTTGKVRTYSEKLRCYVYVPQNKTIEQIEAVYEEKRIK